MDGQSLGGETRGTKVKVQAEGGGGVGVGARNGSVYVPEGASGASSHPGTAAAGPSALPPVTNLCLGQVPSTDFSLGMVLLGIFPQRQK